MRTKYIIFILLLILVFYYLINKKKESFTNSKNDTKIGLLTRCKNEKYVSLFVEYYLSQGIDHIYIIDDNSNDKCIYNKIKNNKNVTIIFKTENIPIDNPANLQKYYNKIKDNFDWLIFVDVDEYITTKKNINNTIRDELITTFKNVDCIKIPWVMMSFNNIKNDPENILITNTYRWNHDKKHFNLKKKKLRCRYHQIEVKCIFKPKKFKFLNLHNPERQTTNNIIVVDGVKKNIIKLDPFYPNLREIDIKNGFLLCYHYRFSSLDHCRRKIDHYKTLQNINFTYHDLISNDYPEIVDETLRNKQLKKTLCLMTRFKNERHILYEFINHYLLEGIDYFILIDDSSDDDYYKLNENWLKPLIDKKIINIIKSTKSQVEEINLHNNLIKKYKWLLICDMDEFFFSVPQNTTLKSLLNNQLSNYDYIEIPWKMFNHNCNFQPKSVIENNIYTHKLSIDPSSSSKGYKYIIKTNYILKLNIHNCNIKKNTKTLRFDNCHNNLIQINHYRSQSNEFLYGLKEIRGGGVHRNRYKKFKKYEDSIFNKKCDLLKIKKKNLIYDCNQRKQIKPKVYPESSFYKQLNSSQPIS